jgi:hypothetical protein
MKNEFKLYAVYDTVGDVLRGDLTSKHKKYWESEKAANNALQGFLRSHGFDPDRFKIVEVDCKVNKYV